MCVGVPDLFVQVECKVVVLVLYEFVEVVEFVEWEVELGVNWCIVVECHVLVVFVGWWCVNVVC